MSYKVPPLLIHAINAKTADFTTDPIIAVKGAKKVTLVVKAASISAGNGVFSLTGSVDDSNFVTFNGLIDNVTNTNGQTKTRVASVTLSTNTTKMYALDLEHFGFSSIKLDLNMTTDGTYDAWLLIEC